MVQQTNCAPTETDARTPKTSSQRVVRMSELVAALSYALDITEGQPQGHAARTCLIGMRLADAVGLGAQQKSDLFYGLLLKDLGCSSNASKMCYLFGADERTIKRDVKLVDWSKMTESFKFVSKQVAPEGSPLQRALGIAALLVQGPNGAKQLVETRCQRGAEIARRMGFSEATATAILQLDEHWDGNGHPAGRRGEEIDVLARVACFAQTVEVFHANLGRDAATAMAAARRGKWFDPELVDALLAISPDDRIWMELADEAPHELAAMLEPQEIAMTIDEEGVDRVAHGFARVVDAKSPWTYRHSYEVSNIAVGIGEQLGLGSDEQCVLKRLGLLHDLGKLGVSSAVLDKPGKPTDDEFAQLKKHPQYTYEILIKAGCFGDLADEAAAHHEKLDGSGYHRGIASDQLSLHARVLCVADMYEAMTAARPYRDGMSRETALEILEREAGLLVCPESVAALKAWLNRNDFESRVDDQLQAVDQLISELD